MSVVDRRTALKLAAAAALTPCIAGATAPSAAITRPIPRTGERIPAIGMGTWQTFNVGGDDALRAARTKVLAAFFEQGGGMVDSSPMYGSAQAVLGHGLSRLAPREERLFSADKIWTSDGDETRAQFAETRAKWGIARFDLMQVHNLRAWKPHLETLLAMKAEGAVRYVGITTSHGRRHGDLTEVMASQPIDFVQLTYNMTHREVESRLLPLAREKGIAVIVNRPYDGGTLVRRLKRSGKPVPAFARAFGVADWPSFLLKWIIAHPAVTVAIPATTRMDHLRENMAAGRGALPDPDQRKAMSRALAAL